MFFVKRNNTWTLGCLRCPQAVLPKPLMCSGPNEKHVKQTRPILDTHPSRSRGCNWAKQLWIPWSWVRRLCQLPLELVCKGLQCLKGNKVDHRTWGKRGNSRNLRIHKGGRTATQCNTHVTSTVGNSYKFIQSVCRFSHPGLGFFTWLLWSPQCLGGNWSWMIPGNTSFYHSPSRF